MKKVKDISTMYTRKRNKECGRTGYFRAFDEKETIIPPKHYGEFLQQKRR